MTKKDGKYVKTTINMTHKEWEEIKATAKQYGLSMSSYLIQLHHNNKAYKESVKFPPFEGIKKE